jgi:hypothetical protein
MNDVDPHRLAHSNSRTDRSRLADLSDRCPHALELQSLNGHLHAYGEPAVTLIVWLFSFVLGFSRLIWARFVLHPAPGHADCSALHVVAARPLDFYQAVSRRLAGQGDQP